MYYKNALNKAISKIENERPKVKNPCSKCILKNNCSSPCDEFRLYIRYHIEEDFHKRLQNRLDQTIFEELMKRESI